MSYALEGLGQAERNTESVQDTLVGKGWTDPWLDADLEVQNVNAIDAPRIPREVRQALIDSGAEVDSVGWDSRGKVHVSWKPNRTYNAVDYANIAKRIFAQATWARLGGPAFGRSARVIMPRYRINNRLSAAQYVYPTDAPLATLAPSIARMPTPEESTTPPPAATVTPEVPTSLVNPVAMGAAALVSIMLVGAAMYVSRAKQLHAGSYATRRQVKRNRSRRPSRNRRRSR
jgi:hypothetical protein